MVTPRRATKDRRLGIPEHRGKMRGYARNARMLLRGGAFQPAALAAVGFAVVAGAASLLPRASASTTTQTFTPVADAYVVSNRPTTNLGTTKALKVQDSPVNRAYL